MGRYRFSPGVRRLLDTAIASVEQLEILLMLRVEPKTWRTLDDLAAELRGSRSSVERRIDALVHAGFVERRGGQVRYGVDASLDGAVAELLLEYDLRRARVIEYIYSRPANAMRSFADAFRLSEGTDDDR